MTRISKTPLDKQDWMRIYGRFTATLLELRNNKRGRDFLTELLSETERIMLAKRLVSIFFLLEGMSSYRISRTLNMSHSTVLKTHKMLDQGVYSVVQKIFMDREERKKFWLEVESAVRAGMPPIAGRGRWKWLYDLDKKYRK